MQTRLCTIFIAIFTTASTLIFGSVKQKPLINAVADENMQAFSWHEKDWEEEDYVEFLRKSIQKRLNPEPRKKRTNAFEFVKSTLVHIPQEQHSVFIGQTTWKDLNLLCGDSNKKLYVGNVIDKTNLELGTVSTLLTLAAPTDNIETLHARQLITQLFIEQHSITDELHRLFSSNITAENVMLSFWQIDDFKHAAKRFYFSLPGFRWLNKHPNALFLKSSIGHQKRIGWITSGILAAVTLISYSFISGSNYNVPKGLRDWANHYQSSPARVLLSLIENKWLTQIKKTIDSIANNRIVSSSSAAGLGTMCALGVPGSVNWAHQCFIIEDCLQKLMIQVASFIEMMHKTYQIIRKNNILAQYVEFRNLITFFEEVAPQSKKIVELFDLLQRKTFKGHSSIFSHKGNILRAFSLMHEVKKAFEPALLALGNIDKWIAIAHLFRKHKNTCTPFCFAEYQTAEKPHINIQEFWHPLIRTQCVIPNSVTLGTQGGRRNIIVTGPNAGGKSTALKSIAISCVLAQTFGIAPAQGMIFTPFSLLATYLNITDDLGVGNSLFKAEVLRTDKLLSTIKALAPEQHSFVIFDEIFNGTTPLEGMASAYSVAKYLSTLSNTICLLATHFKLLTKLENTTDSFSNYMVSVLYDELGNISYPYKLEHGISEQHVAIDILRAEGFESQILDDAQAIIQEDPCLKNKDFIV